MREAFGLVKLDAILNLSLRLIASLSSFGIHIIFEFFILSLCGLLICSFLLNPIFLFLNMSFREDMLIPQFLWIFILIHFIFGIQFASIGHGRGV